MIDIGADLQRAFDEGYEKGKAEMYEHMKNRLDDEYDAGYHSGKADRPQSEWIDEGWHGDWQFETDGRGNCWKEFKCSKCNRHNRNTTPYCPWCGARMKGADDE